MEGITRLKSSNDVEADLAASPETNQLQEELKVMPT